jgi:hypothetical protein
MLLAKRSIGVTLSSFGRGLPHYHFLLTLHNTDKTYSTQDVAATCCAEISDKITDSELYNTVANNMIHGIVESNTAQMFPTHETGNAPSDSKSLSATIS